MDAKTPASHGQNTKSIVYSPDRLLHPMKRVDSGASGERNPQNRDKSGYVRISWDEALDLVASEIKRLKSTYGPGVMAVSLLDQYGVFKHTGGSAKHHWVPLVIAGALILGLATWTIRRRHGGGIIEPAKPAK